MNREHTQVENLCYGGTPSQARRWWTRPASAVPNKIAGKDEAARAIHAAGSRAARPFVPINCAGIVGTLAESLLFGHEKGSFTNADDSAIGAFRAAHGGILFLDEIGELPLEIQPKLLRALELREVMPVGATRSAGRSPPPRATTAVRRPCSASRPRR